MSTKPRQLLTHEVADFLIRHPFVAAQVTLTKTMILTGEYSWDGTPYFFQKYLPGVIPPWGLQINDYVYKLVTVFPARNGLIMYTGYSPVIGDSGKPEYEPEPFDRNILDDIGRTLSSAAVSVTVLGVGYLLYKSRKGSK